MYLAQTTLKNIEKANKNDGRKDCGGLKAGGKNGLSIKTPTCFP